MIRLENPVVGKPIIVIGAARSGTKMLRAAIAAHPDVQAIPYDINYVWKYGNYDLEHDELGAERLHRSSVRYIRTFCGRFLTKTRARTIVEKTVSNTLRVGFVQSVFPDCRFVNLVRDGRDVAASARRMWKAPADTRSLIPKAMKFPLRAIPTYAAQYVKSYADRKISGAESLSSWGPRFQGIDEIVKSHPLIEVCGIQWKECVEKPRRDLEAVPADRVLHLKYEEFVADPIEGTARIMEFLGLDMHPDVRAHAESVVVGTHVDKWKKNLSHQELDGLLPYISDTLEAEGYHV